MCLVLHRRGASRDRDVLKSVCNERIEKRSDVPGHHDVAKRQGGRGKRDVRKPFVTKKRGSSSKAGSTGEGNDDR